VRGRNGATPCDGIRRARRAALLALPLLAILLAATGAQAQTRLLVGNASIGSIASRTISHTGGIAQGFTTGAASAGYSVASLDLRFASTLTAGYLSSLEVTIREENSGQPGGTVIGTFTVP